MSLIRFFNLNTTTRMALRAACAALLCLLLTEHFYLSRGYWATLTALSLITPSLGSSIYQSLIRFIMTILGCFIGWGLFLLFKNQPEVLLLIALVLIFVIVYTLYHHFVIRMIVTGISVVIVFAFLGGWDLQLLWIRAYETLIGAGIAIAVNALIFPEFSKNTVKKDLKYLMLEIERLAVEIPAAQSLSNLLKLRDQVTQLEAVRIRLEQNYEFARFELFLRKAKSIYYENLHTEVSLLCFYYLALLNVKITALENPKGVWAYLVDSASHYYQERINQEFVKFKSFASPD